MGATRSKARRNIPTPVPVRFGAEEVGFYRLIAARANAQSRSVSGQLKYYARLGMIAEDNPDLPLAFIEGILEAQAELKAGLGQPYHWGVLNGHPTAADRSDSPPIGQRPPRRIVFEDE